MDPWPVPPPLPHVSIEIGDTTPAPPPQEKSTASSFVYAIAVGAIPPILAGLALLWAQNRKAAKRNEELPPVGETGASNHGSYWRKRPSHP